MRLFRKKYIYEFLNGVNFGDFDPKSPEEMIGIVESESYRLEDEHRHGSVIAAKSFSDKKIFVAIKVDLPLSENADIDELLQDLYSKKYVPFNEHIFDGGEVYIKDEEAAKGSISSSPETSEAEMPNEMKALLAKSKAAENLEPVAEPTDVTSNAVAKLEKQMAEQRAEVAELRKQLAQREAESAKKDSKGAVEPENPELPTNESIKPELENEPVPGTNRVQNGQQSTDDNLEQQPAEIVDVVHGVSNMLGTNLADFVASEKAKILADLRQYDKRYLIEPEVKSRIEEQKKTTIRSLTQQSDTEKSAAISSENERHANELKNIDVRFTESLNKDISVATTQLDTQAKQEIAAEYKKQTSQLDNILKGKTDELQMRQREINDSMRAEFEAAMSEFNNGHEAVIKEVENQRVSDNIISMRA
ncbi:hypothetical protein WOSG25_090320 [Weissella oryzae SG25]|uniref:Uncharacterized protein n=1 Tax=Weissella oryzae (strain DSM 25784 / JCM 18191 / LMG 30913 / SG25) TaxID=1329250 RepID=A0A069CU80_WEIOS|nr:hypothetical protein [Weissella oryzae]GAK31335.1 hypothetical protein WOSG25_090320 [Weissella oryzae SG25]